MIEQVEILKKNFDEYFEIAEYSFEKRKFNTAVVLYYKALVELCDYELFTKFGKIGVNHNERFDLLKEKAPILFSLSSKLFRFYRDSYNKEISEGVAKLIKQEVENAKRIVFDNKKN